jgi:hypothetical protein
LPFARVPVFVGARILASMSKPAKGGGKRGGAGGGSDHIVTPLVTPEWLFFWHADGGMWSCMSQWSKTEPFVDASGARFTTAEQWMMAGKARLFGDHETLALIMATHDPKAVKALGRRVSGFDSAK